MNTQGTAAEAYDNQVVQPNATDIAALESFREYALSNIEDEDLRVATEGIKDVATVAGFAALFGAAVFGANVVAKAEAKAEREKIRKDMRSSLEDLIKSHKSSAQVIVRKIRQTYLNDEWLDQQNFNTGVLETGTETIWNYLSCDGQMPSNFSTAFGQSRDRFDRFVESVEGDLKEYGRNFTNLATKIVAGEHDKWAWNSLITRMKNTHHPMEENLGRFIPLSHELGRLSVMYPATDHTPWYRGRYNFRSAPANYPRAVRALDKKGVKEAAKALVEMIEFFFTKSDSLSTNYRWMPGWGLFFESSFSQTAKHYEASTGERWDSSFIAQVRDMVEKGEDPLSEAQEAYGKSIHRAIQGLDMLIRQSMKGNVNVSTELKEEPKVAQEEYSYTQEGLLGVGALVAGVIGAIWYSSRQTKKEHQRVIGEQKKKSIPDLVSGYGTEYEAIIEKIKETYLNDEWLNEQRYVLGPITTNVKEIWDALSVGGRMPTNLSAAWKASERTFEHYGEVVIKDLIEWGHQLEAIAKGADKLGGDEMAFKRARKEMEDLPFPLQDRVGDFNKLRHELGRSNVTYGAGKSKHWTLGAFSFGRDAAGTPRAIPALDKDDIKEAAKVMIDMVHFVFNYASENATIDIREMSGVSNFIGAYEQFDKSYEEATGEDMNNDLLPIMYFQLEDREDPFSKSQYEYMQDVRRCLTALDHYVNASFQK